MADAADLKSAGEILVGSSPTLGTIPAAYIAGHMLPGRIHPFPPDKEAGGTPSIDSPGNSIQTARGDFVTLIC